MGLTIDLQGPDIETASPSKYAFDCMSNEADIETEAFTRMQKLKLLQLDYLMLSEGYRNFPKGLTWLRWHGFSLESLPMDFDFKRLVVLDMRFSSLKQIWKDTKVC